jgi:hypothetical protein
MDYSMISKLEKAKQYAKERERYTFNSFQVSMEGSNGPHVVTYENGKWNCDCKFFQARGRCSHTMSLEIILEGMVDIAYDDQLKE